MIGHASMHADSTYISWWPNSEAYRRYGNSKPIPGVANTFVTDLQDKALGEGKKPDYTSAPISGLDTKAIREWWMKFKIQKSSTWSMDNQNCSWVVMIALKVGGADRDWVFSQFFSRLSYPVSPIDCRTAAELLSGRSEGAINTIARYARAKIVNPLSNFGVYGQSVAGHIAKSSAP
jgi:hypothetical protein